MRSNGSPGVYAVPPRRLAQGPVIVQPLEVPSGPVSNTVLGNLTIKLALIMFLGRWRDNLFCCFSQCAPSCLMSFFCPCIMIGQMCQRMQLSSCSMVFTFFVALYIFLAIMSSFISTSVEGVFFLALGVVMCALRARILVQRFRSFQ